MGADLVDAAADCLSVGTNGWAGKPNASDLATCRVIVTYNVLD